ncbi:MAG: alpha/beta hydrolase [Pararobbsia sp.]
MTHPTHHTAPTQFVEANGIRFAYRRFGNRNGVPLVFNPHLMGNLDSWDPAVTDGLSRHREVILFNNAGVASSSGEVPRTCALMAKNAEAFIDALGLREIDVLGFSIDRWLRSSSRSTGRTGSESSSSSAARRAMATACP